MSATRSASVVLCGAGIAGVSVAYFLAVRHGIKNVVLIDERPPLTMTSDKSTECYRNWWPGPGDAMVRLMNRSIDLLEEFATACGNLFHLNQRGYLYVTTDMARINALQASAEEAAQLGAGALRLHAKGGAYRPHSAEGFAAGLDGADLLTDSALIGEHFPYLSKDVAAVLHVRRAGWLSAQQYGMWLLDESRAAGVELVSGKVTAIGTEAGRVSSALLADGTTILTDTFVNAAGPYLADVGQLLGVEIPVVNELHLKSAFNDSVGAVGRDAPLVICADGQTLDWSAEERAVLADDPTSAWLLGALPSGAHTRPEGDPAAQSVLVLWDVHNEPVEANFPPETDPLAAELAVRGLGRILPGMKSYVGKMPRPFVDGGYYTKTRENRPLAGPLPVEGAYVIGAMSGYGIMAAAGLADLLAAHITGVSLPHYAPAFTFARYADPAYQQLLSDWGESWQL
ncbi:MAG: FAD-binding oxidoreductase [Anaerolineae bacterium]|nr:MAG: FAD-binding oxidoreductase [Anaerolineae bacterium]